MQLKTILNRVQKQRFFVYGEPSLRKEGGQLVLDVPIYPRANSRPVCSGCFKRRSTYDHLDARRFEFVPLWGILVFFLYVMRRVNCPRCGVVVEAVPWATGKHQITTTYAWFLAGWAKRLSWTDVAVTFKTSWDTVYRSVEMAVEWGRAHMSLEGVTAIGIDEIALRKGHRYLTLVYQIDEGCRRLLWIGAERKAKTLGLFFDWLGATRTSALRFVASDMWKPYINVIAERATGVVHILDRFHIMSHFSKAIDKVRASEARKL